MELNILNEKLNYEIKEIGILDGNPFAIIVIDNYEEEEISSYGSKPKFIFRRTTNEITIPISKKTFEELNVMMGRK